MEKSLKDGVLPPACLPPTSYGRVLKAKRVSYIKSVVGTLELSLTVDLGHPEEVRAGKHGGS